MTGVVLSKKFFSKLFAFSKRIMQGLNLEFHNWQHVRIFLKDAEILARGEKLGSKTKENIKIAVLLHDVGFLKKRQGHEAESAKIAENFLSGKLPEKRIKAIQELILATRLKCKPKGIAQKIMRDADASTTGKKHSVFLKFCRKVFLEEKNSKSFNGSWAGWLELMAKFLKPEFFTKTARKKFGKNRAKNLEKVMQEISRLN